MSVGINLNPIQAQTKPTKSKSIITQINLEKPLNLREFESFAKENNLPTELTLGTNIQIGEYLVPTQLEYKTVEAASVSPSNYKTQLETIKKELKNLKETVKNRPVEAARLFHQNQDSFNTENINNS